MRPRTTMQQWPCTMWGGKAPQSERVRRRFFSPLHRLLWLSGRQQRSILMISSPWTQTHTHMRQSNLMPRHKSTNKKYQHGYTNMNFTPLLQSCMNNQTDSSTLTFTWSGLCGDAVFPFLLGIKLKYTSFIRNSTLNICTSVNSLHL